MKQFWQFVGLVAALCLCTLPAGAASTDFEDIVTVVGTSNVDAMLTVINQSTSTGAAAGYFEGGSSGAVHSIDTAQISSDNDAYGLFNGGALYSFSWIDMANSVPGANPSTGLGRLYWQQSDKTLHVLDDAGTDTDLTAGGGGGMTSFTLAGDSGTPQTITNGNTLTVAGGTNGINTTAGATDTVIINLDTTEIDGNKTFGAAANATNTWTFDVSSGTDPTLAFTNGKISTNGDFGLPTGGNILVNAAVPRRSVMIPAYEMWASTTNGATGVTKVELTTNKQNTQEFTFSGTSLAKQYVEYATPMPDNWDGGTVYAIFYWSPSTTSTNGVRWGIQGRSYGDAENLDQAWGTAQEVTDNGTGAINDMAISAETSAITLAGTPAGGEFVQFRIYRDATNAADTLISNVGLHAIKLEYTIQDYGE